MVVLSEAGHEMSAGEAFSAGLGLAIGLLMGQHLLGTIELPAEVVAKRVVICQKCAAKTPLTTSFVTTADRVSIPVQK